ncbi:hypothetical protein PTKIN_Ptkin02bG0032800 [Pterospermum kingtungense]
MDREGERMKNSDIISNLPDNITEEILARLPIQDAVRTSVLSRNWRYRWTTCPDLIFDDGYSTNPARNLDRDKLVKVIYSVLSRHKGPIQKFCLSYTGMKGNYSDIDQWIKNFLSSKGIGTLRLAFMGSQRYKIHSSLFSCANLRDLRLDDCILPSPSRKFGGFNSLTRLWLQIVSVNNEGFRNLIAKCPKLKTLILTYVDGLKGLNIDYAPSLEVLKIFVSGSPNICLKNTPHLVSASIDFFRPAYMNQNIENGRSISSIDSVNFLSNLKSLDAGSSFLKLLARGSVRKLLPSIFKNLCYVFFRGLMFEDVDSLSLVLGLITRSPNLSELIFQPECLTYLAAGQRLKTVAEHLDGESRSIGCLMKLRYVKMWMMAGVEPEMELIKLILAKSPSLEQMKITPDRRDFFIEKKPKIVKDLIRFPRASKVAEVIYEG